MQENNAENQNTTEDGIAVQCAHLHPRGHAQTMINPPSLKDYKRTKRFYTLNDSLLDNVIVSLNLLRGYDQRAPLNLKVSSRNQMDHLTKNKIQRTLLNTTCNISPFPLVYQKSQFILSEPIQ